MASTAANASLPAYMLPGEPVSQPPHLEGDPSLATEILPGPPSLVSIQQSMLKRDPKKISQASSYLPPTDPGSTYSGIMHGTLIGHEQEATRLKRTKSAIGRAQRASARNQNGAVSGLEPVDSDPMSTSSLNPILVDLEPDAMIEDEPSISRSNSSQNLQDATSSAVGRPKRKDKGKGKEPAVKVKEEPKPISLHTPDPPQSNLLNNDDHCSSCRSYGALVYCDGCPRAFHLWCLDPPMESVDEGDSRWFCPGCTIRKHPPRKPPPSLLAPLIHQVDNTIPTEFQLPEDVRAFFRDVGTGPKGTYVDTSELKPPRLNRHGQLEERDTHRLKDRNGAPVLCFRCGTSALPGGLAATAPATKRARRSSTLSKTGEAWKNIISCDYCTLHWHLDCLDPPLSTIPPFSKKWMCPNHAERILPQKHRIPKQNAIPIEITKSRQYNNGNIEVTHPIAIQPASTAQKVSVDEVLINGRRYRVPERVIVLDFWNKLNKSEPQVEKESNVASAMSSPLTSLSSLDDDDQVIPDMPMSPHDPEDLKVAQMLCSLSLSLSQPRVTGASLSQRLTNGSSLNGPQSETVPTSTPRSSRVIRLPKVSTSKLSEAAKPAKTNGSTRSKALRNSASGDYVPSSVSKRKKLNHQTASVAETSTRELRSRSKNNFDSSLTSISSRADDSGRDSMTFDGPISTAPPPSAPATAPTKPRQSHVKVEEGDNTFLLGSASIGPSTATATATATTTVTTPVKRRGRAPAKASTTTNTDVKDVKEKRGRKRKEREDELPNIDDKNFEDGKPEKKERKPRKKVTRTPGRRGPASPIVNTAVDPVPSIGLPTTPSLKIRLPRLNSGIHASPSIPNTNGDTPTRL